MTRLFKKVILAVSFMALVVCLLPDVNVTNNDTNSVNVYGLDKNEEF